MADRLGPAALVSSEEEVIVTSYLVNTRTNRKFEIIKIDREKNLLTLRGETNGIFEEPYEKERLKALGYTYVQKDTNDA